MTLLPKIFKLNSYNCINLNKKLYHQSVRQYGGGGGGNLVSVDKLSPSIALLQLNSPPVNSLNLDLINDITATFKTYEDGGPDGDIKGIVLGTTHKSVFSSGLDMTELYNPDEARLREFWRAFQELFITLYGYKLPVVCAITGHAPAGGALIAMTADYRIMQEEKHLIGLNEAKFGIVAPPWFGEVFKLTVGHRNAEFGLMTGKLYSAKEAYKYQLIDEIGSDRDNVINRSASILIDEYFQTIPWACYQSKMILRKPIIDRLIANREHDLELFTTMIMKEDLQKHLGEYLQSLKNKSRK